MSNKWTRCDRWHSPECCGIGWVQCFKERGHPSNPLGDGFPHGNHGLWDAKSCRYRPFDLSYDAPDPDPSPVADEPKSSNSVVVYVSGPMAGIEGHNFPAFNAAAKDLRAQGYAVVNPAENFDGRTDVAREDALRLDVGEMVTQCNAIYFLPGWQKSAGARLEWLVAKELGFKVVNPELAKEPVELEASAIVRNGEREAQYGHPGEDFRRTAGMWSSYLGVEVTAHDVALMMIMIKASRLRATPDHHDSLVDIVGYAVCYDRLDER